MRLIIDTDLERIIVPDSFFNKIDAMNKILKENGSDKKIEYTEYVKEAYAKAIENALIRKADIPSVKK